MLEVALLCRLLLAGVLLVSGVSKLLDRVGTREAVSAFGVPARWAPPVAALLAPLELLVACLLVLVAAPAVGPPAALLLLTVFTAAVLENLRRGRRPACHCFGRLGSSDISGRTVLRNLVLGAAGAAALFGPGVSAASYLQREGSARLVLVLAVAAAAVTCVLGAEALAGRRRSAQASQAGARQLESDLDHAGDRGPAPAFTLPTLTGDHVALADLLDGVRPVLLTFLSPGCGPCKRLRPYVARWHAVFADRVRVAAVVSGTPMSNLSSFGDSPLPVLLDEDREVAAAYDVASRPAAVVVSPDGRLLGPAAAGELSVRRLMEALLSGQLTTTRPEVPAASLTLLSSPGPRSTVTTAFEDGHLLVVDEVTAASATLDGIGAVVWQCLDGRSSLEEIVHDIAEEFQASRERVARDVLALVRSLGSMGLLAGVAPEPAAAADSTHPHPHTHPHAAESLVSSS